ncbi:hypothetical protein BP6252_07115 [Coleophoma cylindrospora]|uniref:Pal1 cell morphology protein n=1 Tax=Coleophoma cylindrospora TaxID=1849047 RepID=A0A3D8RH01_9HELO|nr:hypothetical protein BP6252_07115 [Coleophoma cylindrospora]
MAEDKQWAQKYLLDPLTAPEPSQETGPGSHFVKPASRSSSSTTSKGPSSRHSSSSSHHKTPSVTLTKSPQFSNYPTPPSSASPTRSSFHPSNPYAPSHLTSSAFSGYSASTRRRSPTLEAPAQGTGRRRGSSLTERFAGDMSHRPLDQIRQQTKKADRSPHLKKKHLPGADSIDILDAAMYGGPYHHEGPYDATLLARNTSYKTSPVAATESTNAEAIRATPRENIRDALEKHVPLQGVAVIPPGFLGPDGKPMQYEEGADLMREEDAAGGAYKRWPGERYHPDDLKGKGEPSFMIERALKEQKHDHRRIMSDGTAAYEMTSSRSRPTTTRTRSGGYESVNNGMGASTGKDNGMAYGEQESSMRRSNTTGGRISGLKRRLGSLRRSKKTTEA